MLLMLMTLAAISLRDKVPATMLSHKQEVKNILALEAQASITGVQLK